MQTTPLPFVMFALGVLLVAPASAQEFPAITYGTRVRISAPSVSAQPLVGKLREVAADTVRLTIAKRGQVGIPVTAIQWVERSDGRAQQWIGLGAVAGAVIGGVIATKSSSGELDSIGTLIAYPFMGAVAGAAVGFLLAPQRWTRFPVR